MGISKNNDLYYAPSYLYKSTRTLPPQNNLFDLKKIRNIIMPCRQKKKPSEVNKIDVTPHSTAIVLLTILNKV